MNAPPGDAAARTLTLLGRRAPDATLCPSEVARSLAGTDGDWRARMPMVHEAVARLVAAGQVRLSWQGAPRDVGDGPYRIGRSEPG